MAQANPENVMVSMKPKDHATVTVNPPGFVWKPIPNIKTYTLQLSSKADFSTIEHEFKEIYLNVFCPDKTLKPGKWFWRFGGISAASGTVWSETREFYIPEGAAAFPQPKIDDLLEKLPVNHPRMLVRPEDKRRYTQSLNTNYPALTSSLLANADFLLSQPVLKNPNSANEAVKSMETCVNLAFAYFLSDKPIYGNKVKEWLLAIANWPADSIASVSVDVETAARVLSRGARSYTFAQSLLTQSERSIILKAFTQRGQAMLNHLQAREYTVYPYIPGYENAWQALGEAGTVFSREIPQSKAWLQYAMSIFYTLSPIWGDNDGGWHAGIANWQTVMNERVWWLDILESSFGINGYKNPFYSKAGDFAMYTNPPGSTNGGFGVGSENHDASLNGTLMGRLASKSHNPYWLWYAIMTAKKLSAAEISYKEALRAETPDFEGKIPSDVPSSKIFRGIGVAALHSQLEYPEGDSYLLFKSSPLGTVGLGDNAQNSFMLSCNQETVLGGFCDLAEAVITVNGKGQRPLSSKTQGKIVQQFLGDSLDYVAGDATDAYEGQLKKWVRHVFFVKPDAVFMVDEIETPKPAQLEYNLFAKEPFDITDQYKIEAKNKMAGVRIAFASPADLAIKQVRGTYLKSQTLWHLQAKPKEKTQKTTFVTIYLTHNVNSTPNINASLSHLGRNELYGIHMDYWNIGLVIRNGNDPIDLGMVKTDASILLIQRRSASDGAASMLATGATYFDFQGKRLAESKEPAPLFIPKEWLVVEKPADIPADASGNSNKVKEKNLE